MKRIILSILAVIFLGTATEPYLAVAADKYWVGESGAWEDPVNWSLTEGGPGGEDPPSEDDDVFLIQSDNIDRTIYYSNALDQQISSLMVDATGEGSMALEISGGLDSWSGGSDYIGYDGDASVTISGGDYWANYSLYVGYNSDSSGTVYLEDGYLHSGGEAYIGYSGHGLVVQTGGTATYGHVAWASSVHIGENAGGFGEYYQIGGEFRHILLDLGGEGTGIFSQSGGTNDTSHVNINDGGIYNLSGTGSLNTGTFFLLTGGTFNQSGGENYIPVPGPSGLSGTYNLSGGILRSGPSSIPIDGTFNQSGGTFNAEGGIRQRGAYNLSGGFLTTSHIINENSFNYSGGNLNLTIENEYYDNIFTNNGAFNLSGDGTRTVNGDVVNNGTVKTTHTTAVFTGTFTNNGAYISDPSTQFFHDLIVNENGYLVGQYSDRFFIEGDFLNQSTVDFDWDTKHAYLSFIQGDDMLHDFYLAGDDLGASMYNYADNFAWGTLDITDNFLSLFDGNDEDGAAQYLSILIGAEILDDTIANIVASEGINIYYNPHLKENSYLAGLDYKLTGGGYLMAAVPEPATFFLLCTVIIGLIGLAPKKESTA